MQETIWKGVCERVRVCVSENKCLFSSMSTNLFLSGHKGPELEDDKLFWLKMDRLLSESRV